MIFKLAHIPEWVVSSMMFGAAVGAVGSGWLSWRLGRKKSLMIGAVLFCDRLAVLRCCAER